MPETTETPRPAAGARRVLVGRKRERGELGAALDAVGAGHGRLILLAGEPGIGKTRLLDDVSAAAALRGHHVVWGRCWESGGAPAYFPFSQALKALWRSLGEEERARIAGADGAAAAQLIPGLGPGPRAAPAGEDPAEARFALSEAVAHVLRVASAGTPVVLALDDLHGADRSSLALLAYLARELRTMAVLIVGTFRDVEARLSPEVSADLGRIAREGVLLSMVRLDRAESAELASQLGCASDKESEALYQATQGNPLFLAEMLRGGWSHADGAPLGLSGRRTGELPHGVRELIRQRLGWLSAEAREALEVAATLGDEFGPAPIAEVLARDAGAVEAQMDEAARAGIVEGDPRRLRFGHALFREGLYRDLPASRRQRLHGAVLAVLERRHEGAASAASSAELAHHALEAGPELVGRAVRYAARAADAALEVAAYEDAILVLERAQALAIEQAEAVRPRAEATLALGLARIRAGDSRGGKSACLQTAALARGLGDGELLARAALGYGTEILVGVIDPVLVGLLEESLARLPPADSPLRVNLQARLAGALQPAADATRPIALAREAIAGARRLNDDATLLNVLYAGMAAMMDYVAPAERVLLNQEIEALATRLGDRSKRLRAHARLVFDLIELPDLAAAATHVEMYGALAEETRLAYHRWRAPLMRAMLRLITGDVPGFRAQVDEARAAADEAGSPEAVRSVASCRLFSQFLLGDLAGTTAGVTEFSRLWSGLPGGSDFAAVNAAAIAAYREDAESARHHLALIGADSLIWAGDPSLMAWTSESVSFVRDRERAAALLERLRAL